MSEETKLSRRGFVKGSGLLASAAALLEAAGGKEEQGRAKKAGPGAVEISLNVNGAEHRLSVEPRASLVSVLRDELSPAGPDDGLAHASRCGRGRICCVAEKRDDPASVI